MTLMRDVQAERIARELEDDIVFARLVPGQKLREEELADRFSASRHHVREALSRLAQIGVVSKERNKGAIVRMFSAGDVRQMYEVRELLQRHAALRIPLPVPAAAIAAIERIQADYEAAIAQGDLRRIHTTNDFFHLEFFRLCGNEFLVQQVKQFMDLSYAVRANSFDPANLAKAAREHMTMIRLLSGRDPWALAQICVDHIQFSKARYLTRLAGQSRPEARADGGPARGGSDVAA